MGRTTDVEVEDDGSYTVTVRCQDCAGSGLISSCQRCLDAAPVPELEDRSGLCRSCAIDLETADADAERLRVRVSR